MKNPIEKIYEWDAPKRKSKIKVKVNNALIKALIDLENTCLEIRDKLKIKAPAR